MTYYFIDNEYYFARGQIYGEYDDAERFAYYSKAVLEVLPDLDWKPDVINCNDWQTALVPVYYNLMFASRPFYENIKTVFTIHNIQYQGRYGREILEYVLGIDDAHFRSGFMAMDGDVNLMKAAIVASTAVTTVSPTVCRGDPDRILRLPSRLGAAHATATSCTASSTASTWMPSIRRRIPRSLSSTARRPPRTSSSTRPSC